MVQKGLEDYLETKRGAFARFYFLSLVGVKGVVLFLVFSEISKLNIPYNIQMIKLPIVPMIIWMLYGVGEGRGRAAV